MTTKYFVDAAGRHLGAIAAFQPPPKPVKQPNGEVVLEPQPLEWPEAPAGGVEVPVPPADAAQLWDDELQQWAMPVPESARREIDRIERDQPMTQRFLREIILAIAAQSGQVSAAMLDPNQPLDEQAPAWLAISVGIRRCVLQERAIRAERAKL